MVYPTEISKVLQRADHRGRRAFQHLAHAAMRHRMPQVGRQFRQRRQHEAPLRDAADAESPAARSRRPPRRKTGCRCRWSAVRCAPCARVPVPAPRGRCASTTASGTARFRLPPPGSGTTPDRCSPPARSRKSARCAARAHRGMPVAPPPCADCASRSPIFEPRLR